MRCSCSAFFVSLHRPRRLLSAGAAFDLFTSLLTRSWQHMAKQPIVPGLTPAENARIVAAVVREEDLQELQDLRAEFQGRIDKAREDGRLYMMGRYLMMLAGVSHEIDRIQKRFSRESLAAHRKEHKALKKQLKAAQQEAEATA